MINDSKFFKSLSKIHWMVWLTLIITIALIRLIYIFSLRDGHHVDETWSYGFANSYYSPNVFGDFDDSKYGVTAQWIDSKVFKDYITVNVDERFSFDSVLYNKREDLSPPLYAILLHTVCSFFPNHFSWSYAFIISVFFFVPTLILVYCISFELTKSKICGFTTLCYYIFSGCGSACFLYLRLYHMMTFFSLLLMWLLLRIYNSKDNHTFIFFFFLPIATVLGIMTHYYFLIIAFWFTFYTGIFLFLKRKIEVAFRVCYIMMFSVLLFFAIYPTSFIKLVPFFEGQNGTEGYSYPYSWELRVVLKHCFYGTIGFYADFIIQDLITAIGTVLLGIFILLLICFLFRNETWMQSLIEKIKSYFIRLLFFLYKCFKTMNSFWLIGFLTVVFYILIIPLSASLFNTGYIERYFFSVMSIFIILYSVFYFNLLKCIISVFRNHKKRCRYLTLFLLLIIFVFQCYRSNLLVDSYKFRTMSEHELTDILSGKNCYIYTHSIRDLNWLSTILYESDHVYIDYYFQYKNKDHIIPELDDDCVLLIVDNGFITQEQKNAIDNGEPFELVGIQNPKQYITIEEYINDIEEHTGNKYSCCGNYYTFIGEIKLYECNR